MTVTDDAASAFGSWNAVDAVYRSYGRIRWTATVFSGLLILVVTALGTIDVVGRYFFDQPLQGQVEISRVLMTYMVFMGLAEAQRQGAHVRIELLDQYMPPAVRSSSGIVLTALAIATMAIVTYATWLMFWSSWRTGETMIAAIVIPVWPAKLAVMLGCLLYTVELAFELIRKVTGWTHS